MAILVLVLTIASLFAVIRLQRATHCHYCGVPLGKKENKVRGVCSGENCQHCAGIDQAFWR